MYRRHTASAAAVVRLPPLPRRPKTNVSVIEDATENPWGLDNPALRQLSTNAGTRGTLRNRSRSVRRSFRSSKITLPDIHGRKIRQTGSARSMRSTYSTISTTTVKSTKSLDMFRYNMTGLKTPSSASCAPNLQVPTPHYNRKWQTPGSAISINSVSTIPLPPIELTVHRAYSRDDLASTASKQKRKSKVADQKQAQKLPVIPDEVEDDEDDDMSVWPGAAYDSPNYNQPSVLDDEYKVDHTFTPPENYHVTHLPQEALPQEALPQEQSYRHRGDNNTLPQEQSYRHRGDNNTLPQEQSYRHRGDNNTLPQEQSYRHRGDNNNNDLIVGSSCGNTDGYFRYQTPPEVEKEVDNTDPLVPKINVAQGDDFRHTGTVEHSGHVDDPTANPRYRKINEQEVTDDVPEPEAEEPTANFRYRNKTEQEVTDDVPEPEVQARLAEEIHKAAEAKFNAYPNEEDGRDLAGITVRGSDAPLEDDADKEGEQEEDEKVKVLTPEEEERRFRSLPPAVQVGRIFAGDFRFLPPMTRTSVRVFFWASPNGFHEEREWIHAKCHTELQQFCAHQGLDFHLVDLHLPGYDHVSHATMDEIFRDQLAICQRLSIGPTVLALVNGDDMPRALPPSMSASDFRAVCEIADRKELPHRELLTSHFRPLVPASGDTVERYQLQTTTLGRKGSTSGAETERRELLGEWDMAAVRLRELLRKTLVTAVVERKMTKAEAKAYLDSESFDNQEGDPGSDPGDQVRQMVSSYPGHTLCYIRQHLEEKEADPRGLSRASTSATITSSLERDKSGLTMRAMIGGRLSVDISKKLNFLTYPVPSMGSHGRVYNLQPLRDVEAEPANLSQQRRTYLTKLCDDILCDVKGVVNASNNGKSELEKCWTSTPLHCEVLHHARLCSSRAAAYCGPEDYLSKVRDYLLDSNYSMVPLVISGGADKNKSKLMAQVSHQVHQWLQTECAVIVRFLGTSTDSSDIKRVLLGIIYQICLIYSMAMPKLEEVTSFDATLSCFNALLASVAIKHCSFKPLVLLFDGLEKATSTEGNHTAAWVPQLCPPNVYMITSIASDCQHLLDVLHVKLVEDMCFLSLDTSLVKPDPPPPPIPSYQKPQNTKHRDNKSTASSDISDTDSSDSEGTLEADGEEEKEEDAGLAELVSKRLDKLEERHGEVVITWTLSYLSIGEGLTEVELLDALSCNEEVMEEVYIGSDVPLGNRQRFPQKLWAMVQRDIRGFLEERYIDNKVVLSLSDEQVQETVESRYLNEGRLCECCTQLANMLQGSQSGLLYDDDEDDDLPVQRLVAPQPLSVTNHRKLRRLPVLLYRSQPFDCISNELKSRMLCNFTWLVTKLKSHNFHNLIEDFHMVREGDDDIEYVRDLLLLCKSVIEQDPDLLCAEILSRLSAQDYSSKPFLHQLRLDASSWCSNLSQGMYIVPKFPCFPSPSGFLRRTIRGPWHVMGMCGDSLMILWGRETGLQVWNATTSECLHHFCNPFTWEDTCLTADCRFVYQTFDTNLVGWDVHTAKKICDINILPAVSDTGRRQNPNMDDSFMTPMAVSEDRMFAALRINKPEMLLDGMGLVLVDLHRELVAHTAIDAMGDRVSNCRFTRDNNRLVVTETQIMDGQVSEIHIFDCLTMESMGEQKLDEKYTILPDTTFLSADESKLIVGCRPDNFLVFSVSDCSPLFVPPEPADEDISRFVDMKMLPTDQVVLLSVDITQAAVLRVSGLDGTLQGPVLTSNSGRPKFLEVAPSQSLAFIGYLDVGTVDIWDLDKACLVYTLRAHLGHMTSTVVSPSCHTLYTGATDGAIKVWKFGDMLTSKGRAIQSARTPRPLLEPNLGNDRQPPIKDTISLIPTDVDEILELDGGESLVDSDDERMLEDKKEADDQELDAESMWSTISENGPTEHDVNDNNEEFDSDDSEDYGEEDASYYDRQTGERMSTATGSRFPSGSTRCTSRARSKTQRDRQSADLTKTTDSARSVRSGGSKQSANMRRNNTSAPGWARDGSFLNHTIIEDEMAANSPGFNIQQLVSGQRLSARTHIRDGSFRDGSFSNRSGGSVRSHQSQKSSHGDRDSTANTDRTSDTNAKLEEIFRKLDQQVLDETPRYDSFREPLLTTTVLGKNGEVLNSQDVETSDVNTFEPTEDGVHMITTHRKGPPVLWNIDRAEIVHRLEVPWDTGTTTELLLAPDGKRVFGLSRLGYEAAESSGYENCVRVWDLETGACEPMTGEPLYADAFVLTPDKKRLLLLRKRDNGHTRFLVLDAQNLDRLLLGEVGSTLCSPYVHVTSDVRYVITCDPGRQVSVWDVLNEDEYGVARHTDLPLATIPPAMTLLDKEQTLLLGTGFGNVLALPLGRVADLPHEPDAALLVVDDRQQGEVLCLELSRDRTLLVTSASNHVIRVIEREERRTRHVLKGHTDLITCLKLSEDKQWLVSGSHDQTVRLWSIDTGETVSTFHTYHDVFNVHLSLDTRTISCLVDQRGTRRLLMLDVLKARQKESTLVYTQ